MSRVCLFLKKKKISWACDGLSSSIHQEMELFNGLDFFFFLRNNGLD